MRFRLTVLALSLGAAGAAAAPPSPAPPAVPEAALEGLEFRNIGPALMGGRIDDFAVLEDDPSTFYVATASGGLWKTAEPRDHVRADLRRPGGLQHRRRHAGSLRPVHPLRGDGRAEQPPVVLLGQRRVPQPRRGQDLDPPGPGGHAPHRPHRGAPDGPRRRLRRRAGPAVGAQPGARPLQDDGRRAHVGADEVRRRGHRLRRRGDGLPQPGHPVRRVLPAAPDAVRLQRRRARAAACGRRRTAAPPGRS